MNTTQLSLTALPAPLTLILAALLGIASGILATYLIARYTAFYSVLDDDGNPVTEGESAPRIPKALETLKPGRVIAYGLISMLFAILFSIKISETLAETAMPFASVLIVVGVFALFSGVGLALAVIDQRTMFLPSKIIYPTLFAVVPLLVIAALIAGEPMRIVTMLGSAVAMWLFYFVVWFVKPGGIGFGDVRLSFLLGAILGWVSISAAIAGFVLPFVLMTVCMLPLMIVGKVNRKTKAPFGPWMIVGAFLAVMVFDIVKEYLMIGVI